MPADLKVQSNPWLECNAIEVGTATNKGHQTLNSLGNRTPPHNNNKRKTHLLPKTKHTLSTQNDNETLQDSTKIPVQYTNKGHPAQGITERSQNYEFTRIPWEKVVLNLTIYFS